MTRTASRKAKKAKAGFGEAPTRNSDAGDNSSSGRPRPPHRRRRPSGEPVSRDSSRTRESRTRTWRPSWRRPIAP